MTNYTYIDGFVNGGDWEFLSICASPYTAILGEYFYVLFGIIPVWMMYLKSQDIILPSMAGLLFAGLFAAYFPQKLGVSLIMLLGTAIGAAMFQVFKGRGD